VVVVSARVTTWVAKVAVMHVDGCGSFAEVAGVHVDGC
jgi:hypothetical protein